MQQIDSVSGSKIVYLQKNMDAHSSGNPKSTSTPGMLSINLSPSEIQVAALVGLQRQIREIQKNGQYILQKYKEKYNHPGKSGLWSNAIEGALGEFAVAKALNQYPTGMESHWAIDVGTGIEVRTRKNPDHQLFLKPSDKPGFVYVLVCGSFGSYHIKGWIHSDEVFMRSEWHHDNSGKTSKCFWVPDSALNPISDLIP